MRKGIIKKGGLKNTAPAFCCLLSFFLLNCQGNTQKAARPKPTVPVVTLRPTKIPIEKQYIGITQAISSVNIRARVEGFLIQKNFIEGKPVKKDQVLYVIDPKPFQAQLDSAKGQLARSIAERDYQQVQYTRMKQLVGQGNISRSQYDQVMAQFHQALAQVDVNKAQLETAQINLGYCYMYSPVDGIVSHKYVDVGNLVGGTEQTLLATVVQLEPIYIEFSPSVSDFGEILKYRTNMPFKAEASLPQGKNIVLHGEVDFVNNAADTPTSTILMRATLKNPEKLILPGIYMNVKVILTENGEEILVPTKAVLEMQGKKSVYLVNSANKVEDRLILTSGQYGDKYMVKSGLQAGDRLITSGLQKIHPGDEVAVTLSNN